MNASGVQVGIPDRYMTSLTHLSGRMRPKEVRVRELPTLSQQTTVQREAAAWLPKGFVDLPRFEIPMDVHHLADLTPVQYLAKYCIVTSRVKKLLYHRQYTKYREPKVDGIDSLDKARRALKDVCTFSVNAKSFSPSDSSLNYYLHGVLGYELSDTVRINFKTFMGIAALAERIFNPNYMSSWWDNEKRLEADYQVYKKLREQEQALKDKMEQREVEQIRLQNQRHDDHTKNTRKTILKTINNDTDEGSVESESLLILSVSPSEMKLNEQVEESRNRLENKISVTKILELEQRPNRCPKEVMEQVDFHAVKWRLKDVNISPAMQRLVRIIINL